LRLCENRRLNEEADSRKGAKGAKGGVYAAENLAVHIALMAFSSFRAIIPAIFSDSAMRQLSNQ
jgi:hypothetical protein